MVSDAIQLEMENYAELQLDLHDDLNEKINAVNVAQLNSYAHIMLSFELNSDFIKNLINNLAEKYNVSKDMIPILNPLEPSN